MKKESLFKQLQSELESYLPALQKAAEVVMDQEVSSFPIFVLHQQVADIGINIVDRDNVKGDWSVNVSTLEEFVAKQLIAQEKVEDFKLLYKSHQDELCLFVLNELGANFIFMPRQNPEGSE